MQTNTQMYVNYTPYSPTPNVDNKTKFHGAELVKNTIPVMLTTTAGSTVPLVLSKTFPNTKFLQRNTALLITAGGLVGGIAGLFNHDKVKESIHNGCEGVKNNWQVILSSAAGTLLPMLLIKSKQKCKLFDIQYELKEMLMVGIGAVAGGLLGGIVKDKGIGAKDKIKEANFQLINMYAPTVLVAGFLKLADKFCKGPKKTVANFAAVALGIGIGMPGGAYISNKLNSKLLSKNQPEQKRKLHFKDCLVHVDDIVAACAFLGISGIAKVLPFIYVSCGYETGKKGTGRQDLK